jgi:uncharacterized membrane protein YqhA
MPLNDHMNADKVLIHDIDELKQKLWKVIIVSLIVHVFKQALVAHVDTTIDLVLMASVVILLSVALYLTEKMWSCATWCKHEDDSKVAEKKHVESTWKLDWK